MIWLLNHPPLSYTSLQWLAVACGIGGAQFIAFAQTDKIDHSALGWTLAVNVGVAGVGIVVAQAVLPLFSSFRWSGVLPWTTIHGSGDIRSEEHTSELQSRPHLVCRLLLEKKK